MLARLPLPLRLLLAAAAMGLLTLLVAAVGRVAVLGRPGVEHGDLEVVRAAKGWGQGVGATDLLQGWAALTQPAVLYPVVALAALVLVVARRLPRRALWVIPAGMLAWALAITAKRLVDRPRPAGAGDLALTSGTAYPSGHATGSAAAAVLLGWLLWPLLRRAAWPALTAILLVVVVLTCLDRVLLGVHHPSDVVAGALLGAAMATCAVWAIGRGQVGRVASTAARPASSTDPVTSSAAARTSGGA